MSGQAFYVLVHIKQAENMNALWDRRGLYGTGFEKTGFKHSGKNSRLSPAEIAVMTGTDEQTVADLISTLEKRGDHLRISHAHQLGLRKMMIP